MNLIANDKIIREVSNSIILVSGRLSSTSYAYIILQSLLRKSAGKHPIVEYISVKTTSIHENNVKIDMRINDENPEKIGRFLSYLLKEFSGQFSKEYAKERIIEQTKENLNEDIMTQLDLLEVIW